MNKVTLRTARLEDLPILQGFEQRIIEVERPFDKTLKQGFISYYDIKALIEAEDTEVIVAVSNEKVVGSGYGSIRNSKPYINHSQFVYMGFMYVKPEFRGQQIVMKIIEALKSWAKSRGIKEAQLEVYNENISAIRAYEKSGFQKNLVNMISEME